MRITVISSVKSRNYRTVGVSLWQIFIRALHPDADTALPPEGEVFRVRVKRKGGTEDALTHMERSTFAVPRRFQKRTP